LKNFVKIHLIISLLLITGCTAGKRETPETQVYTFGNSTENSEKSDERIDRNTTYQVFFSLKQKTECISIEIESVYLQKSFPVQKIPKKTYFIIEKEIILSHKSLKNNVKYAPLGRNFNNDWAIYSPVKICTMKNAPLSLLGTSRYRIRFTTFEKLPVYFVITIKSDQPVIFEENKKTD